MPSEPEEEVTLDAPAVKDTGAWRYAMFRALGFEEWQSVVLAHDRVDWHRVKSAMDGGCTHGLAMRIFVT